MVFLLIQIIVFITVFLAGSADAAGDGLTLGSGVMVGVERAGPFDTLTETGAEENPLATTRSMDAPSLISEGN